MCACMCVCVHSSWFTSLKLTESYSNAAKYCLCLWTIMGGVKDSHVRGLHYYHSVMAIPPHPSAFIVLYIQWVTSAASTVGHCGNRERLTRSTLRHAHFKIRLIK